MPEGVSGLEQSSSEWDVSLDNSPTERKPDARVVLDSVRALREMTSIGTPPFP